MQLEILIQQLDAEQIEMLVAELAQLGFDSFWESNEGLRGYIDDAALNRSEVDVLTKRYNVSYSLQTVQSASWDVALSDRFEAIEISEDCIVRSSQTAASGHLHQIIVDPKLAFGSGEHPSTWLCLKMQLEMDHAHKKVIDIGTGSGILAVMAEKLGAAHIDAFDNNPWAIEVMQETLQLNHSEKIKAMAGEQDELELHPPYDLALGNLNASVLKEYLPQFVELVKPQGEMLLSGYMKKDRDAIHQLALQCGLLLQKEMAKDEWVAVLYSRS